MSTLTSLSAGESGVEALPEGWCKMSKAQKGLESTVLTGSVTLHPNMLHVWRFIPAESVSEGAGAA
jgi:hypothetical protein